VSDLAAVLIDLDGTLVDTSAVWQAAYLRLGDELEVPLPDGFWSQVVGRSMTDSLAVFDDPDAREGRLGGAAVDRRIARLVELASSAVLDAAPASPGSSGGWHWLPGARELLVGLNERRHTAHRADADAGPATALVTSSWRPFTQALMATSAEGAGDSGWPEDAFDAVVCGEDVAHGKPAPDSYLRAAELLGVPASACIVIEDSPVGVVAAESAGMVVLAVPHSGLVEPAAGRAVRHDLRGLSVTDLVALHARLRSGASG